MSYEPADHPAGRRQIAADRPVASATQLSKKLLTLLILASAVAACTGGAGLDIPVQTVDHSCAHDGAGRALGGDGSGCS